MIKRVIMSLQHERIDIYLHLDSKMPIADEDLAMLGSLPHVTVTGRRSGFLGEWSLCENSILLLKAAVHSGVSYAYYTLISAQDYPIKPIAAWLDRADALYPLPMMECSPSSRGNWLDSKQQKPQALILANTWINRRLKPGLMRKGIKVPLYAAGKVASLFSRAEKDLKRLNCTLYGGSAFWMFPDVAVAYILEMLKDENDPIVRVFRNFETPVESFFQTMIMRSALSGAILKEMRTVVPDRSVLSSEDYWLGNWGLVYPHQLTKAYFRDEGKPFTGHPYVYTIKQLEQIKQFPQFFARKFDQSVDAAVLDAIDAWRQNDTSRSLPQCNIV